MLKMLNDEDKTRINKAVATTIGCDLTEVTPNAKLADDLGADSLDTVELGMEIEEIFEFEEIPADEVEKWKTVSDIYTYVDKRLSEQS